MLKRLEKVNCGVWIMVKDYSAWYWSYIPHYRHVDDFPEDDEDDGKSIISIKEDEAIEYRDEADRRWWKFFDEYEYRFNKFTKDQKSWWRFFEKDASAAEKRFLIKLDLQISLFAVISYWSKNLDSANISNAYVSGMKEDLGMDGDDYSNAIAAFTAGTVIFQAFYMWLFPRVSMHFLFFAGDVFWSLATLFTGTINNSNQLYLCRFLVGAFEAGYFIMIHYLLGSWYKPDELGSRGGIFYCGQMLGTLTSGLLQAAISKTLDGVHGRAGWRWMFIIDGVITVGVGILALYMVPGTPNSCCSLFFTDDEIRLARSRLKKANIKPPTKNTPPFFDKRLWKRIFSSWRVYVLAVLDYLFWNSTSVSFSNFALWLKSLNRYSTPKLNSLTALPPALGIIWILLVCCSADVLKSRAFAIFWAEIFVLTSSIILVKWDVSESALWFAFMISYFCIAVSSVVYGWLNDIMRYDPQERSIVLCTVNLFASLSTAYTKPKIFRTSKAPRYHAGYIYVTVHSAGLMIWSYVTLYFYKRQERKDARSNGIVLYNSKTGGYPDEFSQLLENETDDRLRDDDELSIGKNFTKFRVQRLE